MTAAMNAVEIPAILLVIPLLDLRSVFPSFSAIFNRTMQKLPLFSCTLPRNEGTKPTRFVGRKGGTLLCFLLVGAGAHFLYFISKFPLIYTKMEFCIMKCIKLIGSFIVLVWTSDFGRLFLNVVGRAIAGAAFSAVYVSAPLPLHNI